MKDYIFTVRLDRPLVTGLKQAAKYKGETIAVILRQYARDGLERDGVQVRKLPAGVEAQHERAAV